MPTLDGWSDLVLKAKHLGRFGPSTAMDPGIGLTEHHRIVQLQQSLSAPPIGV